MIHREIYWGEILKPASKADNNTLYFIIKPQGEDANGHITSYKDLESVISEITHIKEDMITTFPKEYKIIQHKNTIYSIYPLSDEKRKAIETSLTQYGTKRRKRD
jgi:hypothetical protein